MRKILLTALLAFISSWVCAQERIAVFPFEILDNAVTRNESFQLYRAFSNEFRNKSSSGLAIVPRQDVDRLINTEMDFQLTDFSAQEKTAEMMRVQNATQILSGTIGKMGNSITMIVSLYTYPGLDQLPGGASLRANTAVELFDKIPELVQQMQKEIDGGGTAQSIPEGLKYDIGGSGTVTIREYTGNAATLNIPSRIAGLPVTAIGYSAFYQCSSLISVTIPSSVTSIGIWAFLYCSSLTSIIVDNRNPVYASIDGVLFDKDIRTLMRYPAGRNQRTYVIPSSVTTIEDQAFSGCSSLTSVTIPSSVTSIEASVTAVDSYGFNNCSSLTSIIVDNRNPVFTSIDGVLFDKNIQTLIIYPQGRNQKTYIIPSSVTSIEKNAFRSSSLTSITIPSSVTSIGERAFYGCSSLTSVTIPSSITSIRGRTFSGCRSLTNITIPSSVTTIEIQAFASCESLTSITIPSSVTSIQNMAFSYCSSLTSVTLSRRTQVYEAAFPASTRISYRD